MQPQILILEKNAAPLLNLPGSWAPLPFAFSGRLAKTNQPVGASSIAGIYDENIFNLTGISPRGSFLRP